MMPRRNVRLTRESWQMNGPAKEAS